MRQEPPLRLAAMQTTGESSLRTPAAIRKFQMAQYVEEGTVRKITDKLSSNVFSFELMQLGRKLHFLGSSISFFFDAINATY